MKKQPVEFSISLFSTVRKLVAIFQIFFLSQLNLTSSVEEDRKMRDTIKAALRKNYIIPDILPIAPSHLVTVMYSTFVVNMGNKVDPRYVQHTPSVWWHSEEGSLYTFMMIDADVTSRRNPQYRSRQQWLVVNIPGVDIYKGKTLTEYIGPIAPRNSGLHRNIFLVFKQKGPIEPDEPFISALNRGPNVRTRFSPRKFAEKYKLSDPVAINFFQVGYPIYENKEERHGWYRAGQTPPPHFVNNTNRRRTSTSSNKSHDWSTSWVQTSSPYPSSEAAEEIAAY